MKIAQVILDIQTQSLDAPYTYAVPDPDDQFANGTLFGDAELASEDDALRTLSSQELPIQVGSVVMVPFGGRKVLGFVMSIGDSTDTDIQPAKLKSIICAVAGPFFDEEGAECIQWLASKYIAPLCSCARLFVPTGGMPRMVRGRSGWRLEMPQVQPVDERWIVAGPAMDEFTPRKNAVKQTAIINAVRHGAVRLSELSAEYGSVSSAVKSLEANGVITVESRRKVRGDIDSMGLSLPCDSTQLPVLTDGQIQAVDAIQSACEAANGSVVLVDGVTGSGKTEVYLRAIQDVLSQGRTACVLVPEISLTPQTVARFRGRFGDTVAVLHSRMSAGERYDQWDLVNSGQAKVVVGARSALFAPLRNLGLVVIDEEHEGTYKQESAPRYHARDVAIWMMERSGGAVVLGSATPSIDTLYRCATDDKWIHAVLPNRANGSVMPNISVVDMSAEFGKGRRSMFSHDLTLALNNCLMKGEKAVLLLNQRGFAKFLLCRDCGFVPGCPHCSTSLTYHERGHFLMCHHCGYRIAEPPVCPECGSPYLRKFGSGTQRVEDELIALIQGFESPAKNALVIRMDADTTSEKGAHQRLLEQFGSADAAVLLGTQMIAKGLDFQDVTLVGVINADTQLHLPDFRAGERTFDLVQQVAGRAGRAQLPGHVIVQTYEARSIPIRAASAYCRNAFLDDELPKRELLGYPPYVSMANVLAWGADEEDVRIAAQTLEQDIRQLVRDYGGDGWTVLPAMPCVLAKLRGTYRWHVVVKCPLERDISAILEPYFRSRKPFDTVNVAVDIDPINLL